MAHSAMIARYGGWVLGKFLTFRDREVWRMGSGKILEIGTFRDRSVIRCNQLMRLLGCYRRPSENSEVIFDL